MIIYKFSSGILSGECGFMDLQALYEFMFVSYSKIQNSYMQSRFPVLCTRVMSYEIFALTTEGSRTYLLTSSPVLWLSKKAMSCRINEANKALRILSANLSPRHERNEM